jgi:hypothetical protein
MFSNLIAFLALCGLVSCGFHDHIDFEHATNEVVAELKNCFFLAAEQVALIPASSFAGFKKKCTKDISGAFKKITKLQLSYLTPDAFDGLRSPNEVPIEVVGALNAEHIATLAGFSKCVSLNPKFVNAVSDDAWAGFQPGCTEYWRKEHCSLISTSRIMKLTPAAFGAIEDSITYIPFESFKYITIEQLSSMNPKTFGPCYRLDHKQISAIPPAVFAEGLKPACLAQMENNFEGVTWEQFKALSEDQLHALGSTQVKNLNADTMCPNLDSRILNALSQKGISGLQANCVSRLKDDVLPNVARDNLRQINEGLGGLKNSQWQQFSPKNVNSLYATQIMLLSSDACSVMTVDQFAAICRVGFGGIRAKCAQALPAELALYIDEGRGSLIHPGFVAGMSVGFLRNLRPSIFSFFKAEHASKLSAEHCKNMRITQFERIPSEAFKGFEPACVNEWNPAIIQKLSNEKLSALQSGWAGLKPLNFAVLSNTFKDDLWSIVESGNKSFHWNEMNFYHRRNMWESADCYRDMFASGIAYTQPSDDYSYNWIILASRGPNIGINISRVYLTTLLAGLRDFPLLNLTSQALSYVSPTEFRRIRFMSLETISTDAFMRLEPLQFNQFPADSIPHLSANFFRRTQNRIFSLMSCNQTMAVTQKQLDAVNYRRRYEQKVDWCQMPVNDSIPVSTKNGQRWSEEKMGDFYTYKCDLDMNKWNEELQGTLKKEEEFERNYEPKDMERAKGCSCNLEICYSNGAVSGCFKESAETCDPYNPATKMETPAPPSYPDYPPSPFPGHPPTSNPDRSKPNPGESIDNTLDAGGVFGIVFGVIVVVALSIVGVGYFVYRRHPEKFYRYWPFGSSNQGRPFLG